MSRQDRRSLRKRRESEEENFYIDLNKDPSELLKEVLFHVVKCDVTKSRKLSYLNGLVRLCQKDENVKFKVHYGEIFCCIRASLYHEACEVRAAGLRACRYLLQNLEAARAFCEMKLHYLTARSLDVSLDNRLERIHALRLIRKFLCVDPLGFPGAFTNCLVAVVNEGAQEREFFRACLSTLAQLTLLNPEACLAANGVSVLIKSVIDCQQPKIAEAVLGVVLNLYNYPQTRAKMKNEVGLEHLLAPFTDCHFHYPCEISENFVSEDRDSKLSATKKAVVAVLRSWPGLTYFCRSDHQELPSLIEMLYLPYPEIRKNITDILFEVFGFPVPEWTDDFSIALSSADPSTVQASWHLYDGYVVAEANSVLPYMSKDRTNMTENYFSLVLLLFIQAGVLEALTEVIISGTIHLAVRSTVLLGELLYTCGQFLPFDCCHHCNCLPSLISAAASFRSLHAQSQASAAVTCLYRIHELKKRGPAPKSLALNHLLHVCNPGKQKSMFGATVSKIKLYQCIKKDMTDMVNHMMKDTFVLSRDFRDWDWDLVDSILKNSVEVLKKAEELNPRTFVQKLLYFFKPSSKQFSSIEFDGEQAEIIALTGYHFMEFLLEMEESKSLEFLGEFLADMNDCLAEVSKETVPLNSIFSPAKILTTQSREYFIFIGKLSSSTKGCKILDKCDTFQCILNLVNVTNLDMYIKLVISALDYSKDGFSRTILRKVLTGTQESARLYATNYLRVLLRAGLQDFRKWAIEFLVAQLYDPSPVVSGAALDILEEACNVPENLEALVLQRPQLLWLGDKGMLLLLRFLSVPSGFRYLRDANLLYEEKGILESWRKIYCLKYVKIVEDLWNEALTRHRRNEDGSYGRRSSDTRHPVYDVYLPHHLYGQLVQHSDGIDALKSENHLPQLLATVTSPDFSSDLQLLRLKAALWAFGHIGSYSMGLSLLVEERVIPVIVQLAAAAPVLSIRATCFFVLGLIGSTMEGSMILAELGWESLRRDRSEKWPLGFSMHPRDILFPLCHSGSLNSSCARCPLGRMHYSFSFAVDQVQRSLSTSHSLHSLDVEISKRSLSSSVSSTGSAEVVQIRQKSGVRPRSSSDCQPNWKNIQLPTAALASSESISADEVDAKDVVFKGRSVSSYEVTNRAFTCQDEDQSESNASNCSDQLKSSESESCCGENDLLNKRISSTLPTYSSLATATNSENSAASYMFGDYQPTKLLTRMSRGSSYLSGSSSPDQQSVFAFSSDSLGYATLKNIQRRRVQSFCMQEQGTYDLDGDMLSVKAQSLGPLPAFPSFMYSQDISGIPDSNFLSQPSLGQVVGSADKSENEEGHKNEKRFVGLCLPSDFGLIFTVTGESFSGIELEVPSGENENNGLELHTIATCLASHKDHGMKDPLKIAIDEAEELDGCDEKLCDPSERTTNDQCLKPSRLTYNNNNNNNVQLISDTEARTQLRKEVMRCVTNLGSSIAVKASEQGLLNLKQKYPRAFQDICLYSEVCLYLARYACRLPARRFLQELFLDLNFSQLQQEAESVIGLTCVSQLSSSDF